MTDSIKRRANLANEAMQDQFDAVVHAECVEWPRLSQAVRLEREAATISYSVCAETGSEIAIFYTSEAAERFCSRYGYAFYCGKSILRELP